MACKLTVNWKPSICYLECIGSSRCSNIGFWALIEECIAHEYLENYLNEFTFRFNRRTSPSRGKPFYCWAQQAVRISPVPFDLLAHHKV